MRKTIVGRRVGVGHGSLRVGSREAARTRCAAVAVLVWLAGSVCAFADGPTILWQSDPISPGDTVLLAGADLGPDAEIEFRKEIDDPDRSGEGPAVPGVVVQATSTMVKAQIPETFVDGAYRYTLRSGGGVVDHQINAPSIYWLQGDAGRAATPGGWVRIAGRNIVRSPSARLMLEDGRGGPALRLAAHSSTLWDAEFRLPAYLQAGRYRFKLWNGQGDARSLASGDIEVAAPPPAADQVFDVRGYGAKGDGKTDDLPAFNAAIEAIKVRGGGVLQVPRGTYLVSSTITLPPRTRLVGTERDFSVLILKDSDQPPETFIEGASDFSIENLTILALNHWHLISAGFGPDRSASASNVKIDNIVVRASFYRRYIKPETVQQRYLKSISVPGNGPDAIRLHGKNLSVTRSDIQSSVRSLAVIESDDVVVRDNRLMNGRRGWYLIANSQNVIFENNDIVGADLQASGGGVNSLFSVDRRKWSRNILFKNNRSSFHNGADGEAMTSDGPGGCYLGPVAFQSGTDQATVLGSDFDPTKCDAGGFVVVGGRGMGQYAIIRSINGSTVHFDRPLAVASDATTTAVIVPLQENYLLIGNSAQDTGLALQAFGASVNTVMAGNTSIRTGGFSLWSGPYHGPGQPNIYAQILNNEVRGGYISSMTDYEGASGLIKLNAEPAPKFLFPMIRGVVIRGNRLEGNAGISITGRTIRVPTISDVVIEGNTISETDAAIRIQSLATGVVVQKNRLDGVDGLSILNQSKPGAQW